MRFLVFLAGYVVVVIYVDIVLVLPPREGTLVLFFRPFSHAAFGDVG